MTSSNRDVNMHCTEQNNLVCVFIISAIYKLDFLTKQQRTLFSTPGKKLDTALLSSRPEPWQPRTVAKGQPQWQTKVAMAFGDDDVTLRTKYTNQAKVGDVITSSRKRNTNDEITNPVKLDSLKRGSTAWWFSPENISRSVKKKLSRLMIV